jgi:hypothetical protein
MVLRGKFHSHQTVIAVIDNPTPLKEVCSVVKMKITTIDTESRYSQSTRQDVMLTKYFYNDNEQVFDDVRSNLLKTEQILLNNGWKVVRTKIEHESYPTLTRYSQTQYREIHIKLAIPKEHYNSARIILVDYANANGCHVARNPKEVREHEVIQFLNLRFTEGSEQESDEKLDNIIHWLGHFSCSIMEIKKEVAVLDSNLEMDLSET